MANWDAFLRGAASILDLGGTLSPLRDYKEKILEQADAEAFQSDAEALRSDWQAVSDDLALAMGEMESE